MKIKGAIFDLDGTLVDSMWIWKQIDIEFLGRFQIPLPVNLHKDIEGMSFTETAHYFKEQFQIPLTVEQIKQTWNEMAFYKYENEVQLKPGAAEFLEFLKKKKVRMGIATSNSRQLVETVITALHVKDYFDCVATACEVAAGKPSPDIYYKVANELKLEPCDCIVFEDIPAGILAGKNAGMRVFAVEDEFSEQMRAEKEKLADGYLTNYRTLIEQKWW